MSSLRVIYQNINDTLLGAKKQLVKFEYLLWLVAEPNPENFPVVAQIMEITSIQGDFVLLTKGAAVLGSV